MSDAKKYAEWIVANPDKKGSDEFNTVVKAYKLAAPKQIKEAPVTPQGTMIDRFAEPAKAIASSVYGVAT